VPVAGGACKRVCVCLCVCVCCVGKAAERTTSYTALSVRLLCQVCVCWEGGVNTFKLITSWADQCLESLGLMLGYIYPVDPEAFLVEL
jgi:hypothetical protein